MYPVVVTVGSSRPRGSLAIFRTLYRYHPHNNLGGNTCVHKPKLDSRDNSCELSYFCHGEWYL